MRYANAMNFDSGMFRSLTEEQKSEFYAERAAMDRRRTKGMALGMAGGAALGFGGSMFMDNSTKIGAVTMGSSVGGSLGGVLADRIGPAINNISVTHSDEHLYNSNTTVTGGSDITTALALNNERLVSELMKGIPVDSGKYTDVFTNVLSRHSYDNLRSCSQADVDKICSQLSRELKAELSVVTDCVSRIRKAAI